MVVLRSTLVISCCTVVVLGCTMVVLGCKIVVFNCKMVVLGCTMVVIGFYNCGYWVVKCYTAKNFIVILTIFNCASEVTICDPFWENLPRRADIFFLFYL